MKKDTFHRLGAKFVALTAALAALIWAPVVYAAEPYTGISVTPAAGGDSTGYLIIAAILVVVGVGVYLKLKKPATFDKIMGQAKKLEGSVAHTFDKAPDGTTVATPTADAALQAELAKLKAEAAARAKADADALIAAAQTKASPPVVAPPPPAPIVAPAPVIAPPPPAVEMVAVIPTGPNALGSVRAYPKPLPTDVNLLTYASRLSGIANPATGAPYFPPAAVGITPQFPGNGRSLPECIDTILFPSDWWTAAEVAQNARQVARDTGGSNLNVTLLYDPSLQGTPGYAAGSVEGEAAIQRWMGGAEMEPGLKAACVNSTFVLNRLNGSQINAYLAGGGVGYLPLSPQAYGWRWSNNTWLQPVNDTGAITWDGKHFTLTDLAKVHIQPYSA